jgi:hypothetical protein
VCAGGSCVLRTGAGGCDGNNANCLADDCSGSVCVPATALAHTPCFLNRDCGVAARGGGHTTEMECYNEECLGAPGQYCATNTDCVSVICNTNVCAGSSNQGKCTQTSDCAQFLGQNQECVFGGQGSLVGGVCLLPAGATCNSNSQCASNASNAGVCATAGNGSPCAVDGDCAPNSISGHGQKCAGGICTAAISDNCNAGGNVLWCVTDTGIKNQSCVANACTSTQSTNSLCIEATDCNTNQTCTPTNVIGSGNCLDNTGQAPGAGGAYSCISDTLNGSGTLCATTTLYGPCMSNADCGTNLGCDLNYNICLDVASTACTDNYQCLSDSCSSSSCQCSALNGACSANGDCCAADPICTNGQCQ